MYHLLKPSLVVYLRVPSLALSYFWYTSMTFLTISNLQLALKSTKLYFGYTDNQIPILFMVPKSVAYTKCSVISFGSHGYEPTSLYSLSGIPLQFVSSITDLGVCLNSDLMPTMHCSNIAAMAFNRSCLLLKSFHSNDVSLLVRLYKVYVRPLLESNTQVWNPWLHKDIHCIERVQRFFTRAIFKRAGISYMDYVDRLANLGLQSLEYRRVFYDLVMCYKIYNNLVDLPFESFFTKPSRSYQKGKCNSPILFSTYWLIDWFNCIHCTNKHTNICKKASNGTICMCTYKLPKHGKGYNVQKCDRSTDLSRVRKTDMFDEVTTSWGKWFHIGITRSVKKCARNAWRGKFFCSVWHLK